jgi:hypothetical protein
VNTRNFSAGQLATAIVALACSLTPLAAAAQSDADSWQWRASIYAWLPSISGDIRFPSGESGPSINVDASKLLSNLEFAFMGTVQARKGEWGIVSDLVYASLGGSESNVRDFTLGETGVPAELTLGATLDLNSWVWTLGGTYAMYETEQATAELVFGVRMLDLKQTLDWSFSGDLSGHALPGRSGTSVAEGTNWDAIIGVKGQAFLGSGQRWFLPWYLDVGTGDSDLTWQAMAGVGYQFDWGATVLSWRHLDYEMASDATIENFAFSGLLLGVTFRW